MDSAKNRLKEIRQAKNLSIEDVSAATRIRSHIIMDLENSNYTSMPSVYIISFIRTYCKFLKLSKQETEEIVQEAKSSANIPVVEQHEKEIVTQIDTVKEPETFKKKKVNTLSAQNIISYAIYAALAITILALVYITFFTGDGTKSTKFDNDTIKVKNNADTTLITNNKKLTEFYETPDSLILEAKAFDTAWLRIAIDGNENYQITMYPGDERNWSANNYFTLSIGKEGAIQFIRNGEVLKPFGNKGSVIRNVRITRDNVSSSSTPWGLPNDTLRKRFYPKKKKEDKVEYPRLLEPSKIESSVKPYEQKDKIKK